MDTLRLILVDFGSCCGGCALCSAYNIDLCTKGGILALGDLMNNLKEGHAVSWKVIERREACTYLPTLSSL